TLTFKAFDRAGNASPLTVVPFTLQAGSQHPAPALSWTLDPASDTGTPGDLRTELATVKLTGTTDADATLVLSRSGTTLGPTTAAAAGSFSFDTVALTPGANTLSIVATGADNQQTTVIHTVVLNSAPTVAGAVADFQVAAGAPDTILNFPTIFSDADVNSLVHFDTNAGGFDVELFDQQTPKTVANFLNYVTSGRYANDIFHRSLPGFVIQGGGFTFQPSPATLTPVQTDAAVQNEPVLSNQAGTIAMAKLGNDPNSATSQ